MAKLEKGNLNKVKTRDIMKQLNNHFESKVDIPRIKHGNRQTLVTLISEEALLFAKFLRNERETWTPRIAVLPLNLEFYMLQGNNVKRFRF